MDDTDNLVPASILRLRGIWSRWAAFYQTAGYLILLIGIASSLSITSDVVQQNPNYIRWASFISAMCTSVIAAFNPIQIGNHFREAWRIINISIIKYKLGLIDIAKLVESVEEGEAIMKMVPGPSQRTLQSGATGGANRSP